MGGLDLNHTGYIVTEKESLKYRKTFCKAQHVHVLMIKVEQCFSILLLQYHSLHFLLQQTRLKWSVNQQFLSVIGCIAAYITQWCLH